MKQWNRTESKNRPTIIIDSSLKKSKGNSMAKKKIVSSMGSGHLHVKNQIYIQNPTPLTDSNSK